MESSATSTATQDSKAITGSNRNASELMKNFRFHDQNVTNEFKNDLKGLFHLIVPSTAESKSTLKLFSSSSRKLQKRLLL